MAPGAPEREKVALSARALAPMRLAEPFEALRDRSDAILKATGARPKAYLVALGPEPAHRRRVAFMREWFEAGGIEAVYHGAAATVEDAVAGIKASGAAIACLCGDDETYTVQAEACARAVKAAGIRGLCLAGRPGQAEAALRTAGVDDFIHSGGDAITALQGLYRRIAA